MYVAVRDGELTRIDEVAASYGISRNHLSKVVHNLGAKGYLQTVQGRSGGFRLARDPAEISVGSVIRDFEPDFALVECFERSDSRCRIQPHCVLAGELGAALDAFLTRLDAVSLQDLVIPRVELRRTLSLSAG
jgi:Rrf2 family nitric oxide-sensitive transcriptional repressor